MNPLTPHRNTTPGSRVWRAGRKGANSAGALTLTIAVGVVAALVLALAWRANGPSWRHGTAESRYLKRDAKGSDPPGLSDHQSVEPLRPAAERSIGSELDPVMAVVADIHRVRRIGPAAKGEFDDLMRRLRALLTPANAADVARTLSSGELATPIGTVVLDAWLNTDGEAASAWIASQSGATDDHAWLVAEALTRKPEKLAAFCETLGTDSWAQAFLDYSSRALLAENPIAAVSVAESLSPGERRTRLFEAIACDWMVRDPDAARAWINDLDDPILRHRLVAVGAPSYATTDPLSALEWLLAQGPVDAVPQEPLQTIAGIWRHTANSATVAWLNHLLAGGDPRTESISRPE